MKLAVPDMISNSYFPAQAAVVLGFFEREGLEVELEMMFPVSRAYEALRDGAVDLVGGAAHAALAAFAEFRGVKLLCAQAQGMYWFLVMDAKRGGRRGDLSVLRHARIGAAPWVEMGLRQTLVAAGLDMARDDIAIVPIPAAQGAGVNFGLSAAQALEDGIIDGFWANGMGAEIAIRRGVGDVILDIRRGDGPAECFDFTFASIAVRQDMPRDVAAAALRAIEKTQAALKADVTLAAQVGAKLFPENAAGLITDLIARDLPYYDAAISPRSFAGLCGFARDLGLMTGAPAYQDVVGTP